MHSDDDSNRGCVSGRDGARDGGHRRRVRYSGTHPRRFEQRYKELDGAAYPEMQEHIRAQGRTPAGTHVPVLLKEVLEVLDPGQGECVADCTVGYGGHALAFLERIGAEGRLFGFDLDAEQLARTAERLRAVTGASVCFGRVGEKESEKAAAIKLYHSHFGALGKVAGQESVGGFDVVLVDLGVSSMQIDDPARGFAFKHDGPLDMRMDVRRGKTASTLLGEISEEELRAALAKFADEPQADRVARAIVSRRKEGPIERTRDLVRVVLEAKGMTVRRWRERANARPSDLHPAARTFQALRILVNDEVSGLKQLLHQLPYCLRSGGRAGVISFHSGEDSRVADAFAAGLAAGVYDCVAEDAIAPTPEEIAGNPRSRSARLRWARRAK